MFKKLLIGIAIIVGCIGMTMNANATDLISSKPRVVLINGFQVFDLADFIKFTNDLGIDGGDTLKIYSVGPGGDALIMMGVINHIEALQRRGVQVTTEVAGTMACSANAIVWLAGDVRLIHRHDLVMFHLAYLDNGMGNPRTGDQLTELQKMILKEINDWMQFKLTRTINDTEIVNNMLDEPENWYKGIELFRIGVATKLIEN